MNPPPFLYHGGGMNLRVRPRVKLSISYSYNTRHKSLKQTPFLLNFLENS